MAGTIVISSSPSKSTEFWIEELKLFPSDKHTLLSPTEWLNDALINAAQELLKKSSNFKGFQNTQLGRRCQFVSIDKGNKFIQVLHVASTHWITISNIGCQEHEVVIYDSRFHSLSLKAKLQICSLVKSFKLKHIVFKIAKIQQQPNSCSCGLYALAVATELANGFDPCDCQWHSSAMRLHLYQCFEQQCLSPFPKEDRKIRGSKIIRCIKEQIFCKCYQVNDTKRAMVKCCSCGMWFHLDCVGLQEDIPKDWMCEECYHSFLTYCIFDFHVTN